MLANLSEEMSHAWADGNGVALAPELASEVEDLYVLLHDHRSDDRPETLRIARVIALACLGNNHLWQDMALPNRAALSQLFAEHFTALYERNSGNMKWKKFLYKQLCEGMGLYLCKSPTCGACSDYGICFGPETSSF